MEIMVVLGHPEEDSFNHAIAQVAARSLEANGRNVVFHDLYAEKFDPVLPPGEEFSSTSADPLVQRYIDELSRAQGLVIVHPNWWGMPPAILKGWVDRVFRPGCAYRFEETEGGTGAPVGMLQAQAVVIFNTENSPAEVSLELFGDPLETLWKRNIFGVCWAGEVYRRMFSGVATSSAQQRHDWLVEVQQTMDRYFPAMRQLRTA